MDEKFQTSFIPKKPVVSSVDTSGSGRSLFMVISIFLFIVSLILAGAVFGGKKYLSSQLAKDKENFSKNQEAFDTVTVDTLVKLDKRIESAKKILKKHVAVLPLFDYLESKTLKNIRFKNMKLSFLEDNTVEVTMKGEAKNFSAVALQSDVFAENKNFISSMISDIDLSSTGNVIFNFKTQIDQAMVSYNSTLTELTETGDNNN